PGRDLRASMGQRFFCREDLRCPLACSTMPVRRSSRIPHSRARTHMLSCPPMADDQVHVVAVIGAGPAGLFAARALANAGSRVLLLNRDIKPGGLAEYGIFLDKYKMKGGLRRQFHKILSDPRIIYLGNVPVAPAGSLTVEQLLEPGFDASVFA